MFSSASAFTITLQPSGRSFSCPPDMDILRAGLSHGISLPYSCRSGVCRTCRGTVSKGRVDFGEVHPSYLSAANKEAGFAHLCCAKPLSDCTIAVEEISLNLMPPNLLPARIMHLERLAPDVIKIHLNFPANEPQRFVAGQYLNVLLSDGVARSYSMATAPTAEGVRQVELHIRHMPGGLFTDRLFSTLKLRDLLKVETPLGNFQLDEGSEKPMIMLASGTGFAPIKAMVENTIAKNMIRPIHIYWGGRKRADIYMYQLASDWAKDYPHIFFDPILSDPAPECNWTGRRGFVHKVVMQDHRDLSAFQVYACGAPAMVDAARHDFVEECSLPAHQFFADSFVTTADRLNASTLSLNS
jgi:CDP-4-dehydro-6-deoxyglucose reductase, E3